MIENLRRVAYIDAINQSRERPVISYFGSIPWEIIYSFDILPIRSYGIDYYVVEEEYPYCSMLNSTVEYHRRDKCPFMSVSDYFIVDQFCSLRTQVIQNHFNPVYIYQDTNQLIAFLEEEYGKSFNLSRFNRVVDQSSEISRLLLNVHQSDIDIKDINKISYYTQFIFDLDDRINYLRELEYQSQVNPTIELGQIGGIYSHFDQAVIQVGNYCEGERHIYSDSRSFDFIAEKYSRDIVGPPTDNVNNCYKFDNDYVLYEGEER